MDRLQKKCFVGSVTGHVTLIAIVLTSAAFVSSEKKTDPMKDLQVIDFVAFKTVDELVAPGGGNPNAAKPPEVMTAPPVVAPAAAAQVQPEPEPPQASEPEQKAPPEPEPKPVAPTPKSVIREPAPKPAPKASKDDSSLVPSATKKKRTFDLKPIVRGADTKADTRKRAAALAAEREADRRDREIRRRFAAGIASATSAIGQTSSRGVAIELNGPGGGGLPYANFFQAVMSAYDRAWHLPDTVTDDGATAVATIVIARDGTVITARISKPSGNSGLDESVRKVLDRVKWAAPLPDSAKENQRTVTINFNVGAKRALG